MRSLLLALGLAFTTLSCSAPTEASTDELTGRWQTVRQSLGQSGSFQTTIEFVAGGGVIWESRYYGLYPGQQPNDLASYFRTIGTYATNADALIIDARHRVWWDRFYGADSPEHVEAVTPTATGHSPETRYTLSGNTLTLHYFSYPADAPVATTMTLVRVP